MPATIISGPDAVENLKTGAYAHWPSRNDAENRIEPFCKPGFDPSFSLIPGESIFTIGSCFARNIEKALAIRGFDVVTRRVLASSEATSMFRANILNNYGVPSILNELRWALDGDAPFDKDTGFFENMPGRFSDIHLPASIRPASFAETSERRNMITSIVREAANCRIVVMTLGLIEVWYDTLSGLYLNYSPRRALVMKNPERFELHVLKFTETVDYLHQIVALLKKTCRDDQKILLTVSPVPLTATYTGRDVLVANAVSKSVLRAATDEIVAAYDHIDYFPSYESVTLSARDVSWEDDQRHVESALIDLNIGRMIDAYIERQGADLASVDQVRDKAHVLLARGARKKAMALLEPMAGKIAKDPELAALYTQACLETGRVEDAQAALVYVPENYGIWQRGVLAARIEFETGDGAAAVATLQALSSKAPQTPAVWQWLARAHFSEGNFDEALIALKTWGDLEPASRAPMQLAASIHRARGNADLANKAYLSAIEDENTEVETMLEYAEFLIAEKRLSDARVFLKSVTPESKWQAERLEQLTHFTA